MPPGTLRERVPWLTAYPRVAFAQSLHEANPTEEADFARSLGFMVRAFWRSGMTWRMWYGIPVLLGHGFVLRREALEDVGGFPECSSEDIRLTGRLQRGGWLGVFVEPEELPGEDVPLTFAQFQRRMLRWAKQEAGTVVADTRLMLRAPGVGVTEKLDWLCRNLKFPVRGLALPLWLGPALVALLADKSRFVPTRGHLAGALAITGLAVAVPLLVYTLDCAPIRPRRLAERLCTAVSIGLLTAGIYCRALISWLLTPVVEFVPTGAATVGRSRNATAEWAAHLLPSVALFVGAVIGGQGVLAVLRGVVLAGSTLPRLVSHLFPVLRWIVPLMLAGGLVWDMVFAGNVMLACLALAVMAALIG